MGQYENVAVEAVRIIDKNRGLGFKEAWIEACKKYNLTLEEIKKPCPKHAFIGLCENGDVKGIDCTSMTDPLLNKLYAVQGAEILREKIALRKDIEKKGFNKELWRKVLKKLEMDENKAHNCQMDVVIGLWKNNLIVGS